MSAGRSRRCVVFDLDDTLYDEIDYVRSGYHAVAGEVQRRYGFDAAALLDARLAARRFDGAFQDVVRAGRLPDDALDVMVRTYRDHAPSIQPHPGIAEAIGELRRRDGVVGCITDGRSIAQRGKIAALGLAALLEPVLVSEETGHAKPDPHNFRELMRRVPADDYWYIADNPAKDFVAPNALGWTTVAVPAPRGIHRITADLPAGYAARHVLPLADALALLRAADQAVR